MAWKTEMSYQNANSTLWTEPLWFSLSVPRWLHFPTKLVSAPLHLPHLISSCFSESRDLFFISRVKGQSPVIPVSETNLKQLGALYLLITSAFSPATKLCLSTVWWQPGFISGIDLMEPAEKHSLPSKQNSQMLTAALAWSPAPPGFCSVCRTTVPACYPTTCCTVELSSCQINLHWRTSHVLQQKVFSGFLCCPLNVKIPPTSEHLSRLISLAMARLVVTSCFQSFIVSCGF